MEVQFSQFVQALQNDTISEVIFQGTNQVFFKTKTAASWRTTNASILPKKYFAKMIMKHPNVNITCVPGEVLTTKYYIGVLLASFALYSSLQYFHFSKQPQINFRTNTNFDDIYGMEEVKQQFKEVIEYFLSDKSKYKLIGARLKKGILLYGPSGTGKTLMAKAVAGECGVNFIYQAASEFLDKYVGVGSFKIRELFNRARRLQPCIIFIDEIDAIGSRVLTKDHIDQAASIEKNNTINQLLVELDGFKELKDIFVIAATNNLNAVDPSLLRAGRFDKKIGTRMPDLKERQGIFLKKFEKVKNTVNTKDIETVALLKEFSGADIDAIVNEAALISLRKNLTQVNGNSLLEAAQSFINK